MQKMKARLTEIEARKAEIRSLVEAEDQEIDLEAVNVEIDALNAESTELRSKIDSEKELRSKIASGIEPEVRKIESPIEERKEIKMTKNEVFKSAEYRSAWAKSLMKMPLDEAEQRAVGTALTTTADTYVASSSQADGVNNGGLLIPEGVMLDLMNNIELMSPFFRDIPKTAVSGYVKFPYKVDGSGAVEQAEGVSNTDGQVQWAEIELKILEVSETIRVTWKLEAMSVDGFINYVTEELSSAMGEKLATEALYGDGTGSLLGVTAGTVYDGEYSIGTTEGDVADIYEAISAGIALLPAKKKIGAKIYVATDVMEGMSFTRDAEDRFLHDPINGAGINSIAGYAIEVDPFLNAGDFVIGNPRYYRFNWNENVSITRDVSGKQRINDYTAYAIASGNSQPNCFVYGKKSA